MVGWRKLKLDEKNHTATLLAANMKLDLGGIGKGFAGDEAIKTLKESGLPIAMFEAGGDIVLGDAPPIPKAGRSRSNRKFRTARVASFSPTAESRLQATRSNSLRSAASIIRTSSIRTAASASPIISPRPSSRRTA